ACATSMAGQANETFVLLRSCLEYAGYGLHIASEAELGNVWLNRNQGDAEKKKMITEFRNAELRETIGKHDQGLLKVFDLLYERSIDFGGHPNQHGVTGSLKIQEEG